MCLQQVRDGICMIFGGIFLTLKGFARKRNGDFFWYFCNIQFKFFLKKKMHKHASSIKYIFLAFFMKFNLVAFFF